MIVLFKRLTTLLFVLLFLVSFISITPVFAIDDDKDDQEPTKKYQELLKQIKEYEKRLTRSQGLIKEYQELLKKITEYERQTAADIQKTQVEVEVIIPKREGYDDYRHGSGTVIAKTTMEVELYRGKTIENIVYFIHTNPHLLGDVEIVLKEYKEARIVINIIGKKDSKIEAEIIAWNWATAGLLLRAVVSQERAEDFKFEAAKISNRLPICSEEEKHSDNLLAEFVYAGGYPRGELADSRGKVSKYVNNENIRGRNYDFRLLKTMHLPFEGLVGPGQSGGGIFVINDRTGKPEWIGTTTLGLSQLTIGIPIDVTVIRFLKQVPDLSGLIEFPKYEFKTWFERTRSKTVIYQEYVKEKNKRINN